MEGFRGSETPPGSLLGAFRVSRQGCGARDGRVYRGLYRFVSTDYGFSGLLFVGFEPGEAYVYCRFRLLTEARVEADVTLSHLWLPEFCSATSPCSQVLFSLILPRI